MSKSNTQETGYLKLLYQNIDLANIGDAGGLQNSATAGSFYIALYTDDPTDADTGTEATYTNYARVAVARSAVGWTVSGAVVSNAGIVTFPTSGGTNNTVTHFGVHTASSGGDLVHHGSLSVGLLVSSGDTPKFAIGDLTVTES